IVRQTDESHYEIFAKRRQRPMGFVSGKPLTVDQQLDQAFKDFRANMEANAGDLLLGGRYLLRHVSTFVVNTFLVFMLAAFLLVNPGRIYAFFRSMVPEQHQPAYAEWLARLDEGLSGVVRGQVIICLINGFVTAAGIYYLRVPFWFTLSIVATVCSLIPIFGVLISSVPIVIMALSVSPYTALLAVLWILLIHFIEGNFLNPKILGDAARIHPVLIVFALVTGEYINGVVGALLAVPIFSVLYNTFRYLQAVAERVERRS
ncbi:MAG TPA: AI-2E family transporter, partial [bacterium]|nr:AI-2E family transporter [bacterium]